MFEVRIPGGNSARQLSEIAFVSKANWGYSPEFMEQCRDELVVSEADIESGMVAAISSKDEVAGFYKLSGEPPIGELEMLFVSPEFMGLGLGRMLLDAAKKHAASLGMKELLIDSDPNAEQFYAHMGAEKIGETPSGSIPGRVLPKMILRLH